jgi:hypothetical protein
MKQVVQLHEKGYKDSRKQTVYNQQEAGYIAA